MKALIIDNEEPLRFALRTLITQHCPEIEHCAEADGVRSAIDELGREKYDIVFLDVEMDDGTGFDVLDNVDTSKFQLVFVTAHQHYAVDAFRWSAIDFLLKPIDEDDLQRAVQRAKSAIATHTQIEQIHILRESLEPRAYNEKRIVLRDHDAIHFIKVADISVLEAQTGYTKFILSGGKSILVSKRLKEYEDILVHYGFIRTHHSFIVNSRHIVRYDRADGGSVITKDNLSIPVAQRKREHILKVLSEQ